MGKVENMQTINREYANLNQTYEGKKCKHSAAQRLKTDCKELRCGLQ